MPFCVLAAVSPFDLPPASLQGLALPRQKSPPLIFAFYSLNVTWATVSMLSCPGFPCNSNGKVGIFCVNRERLRRQAYNIAPVHRDGGFADIATALTDELDSVTAGTLHEGMEGRSALGIGDLFNAPWQAGRTAFSRDFPPPGASQNN